MKLIRLWILVLYQLSKKTLDLRNDISQGKIDHFVHDFTGFDFRKSSLVKIIRSLRHVDRLNQYQSVNIVVDYLK